MKDTKNGATRRFSGRLLAKLTNSVNKITHSGGAFASGLLSLMGDSPSHAKEERADESSLDEPVQMAGAQAASWVEAAACHADEPRQAVDTRQAKQGGKRAFALGMAAFILAVMLAAGCDMWDDARKKDGGKIEEPAATTATYTISFVVNGKSVSREVAVPNTYTTEGTIKAYILDYDVKENIESIMGEIQAKIPSGKELDNFNYADTTAWTLSGKTITVTVPLKDKTTEKEDPSEPTPTPTEIEAEKAAAEEAGKFMVYFYTDDTKSSVYTKAAVTAGGNATAPSNPSEKTENGKTYEFDGWEGAYTNIQGHTDIVAKWKEKVIEEPTVTMYTVTFRSMDDKYVFSFEVPAGERVSEYFLLNNSRDGKTYLEYVNEIYYSLKAEYNKVTESNSLGSLNYMNDSVNAPMTITYTGTEKKKAQYTVTFTINDNSGYDYSGTYVAENVEEGTKLSDVFGVSTPNVANPIGETYYSAAHTPDAKYREFINLVIDGTTKPGGIAGLTAADTVQGNTTITADLKLKDYLMTFDFGDRTETATIPVRTEFEKIDWSKLPTTIQNPTRSSTKENGKETTYKFIKWTRANGDGGIGFQSGNDTTRLTAVWETITKTVDLGDAGILNDFAADTRDLTFTKSLGSVPLQSVAPGSDYTNNAILVAELRSHATNGWPEQANDLKTAYASVAEAYGTGTDTNNAKYNQIATALTSYRTAMASVSDLRNYSSIMSTKANAVWDAIFGANSPERTEFNYYLDAFKKGTKYVQVQRGIYSIDHDLVGGPRKEALTVAQEAWEVLSANVSGYTTGDDLKAALTEKINNALNISGSDSATIRTLTEYLVNALAEDLAQFDGLISDLRDIDNDAVYIFTSNSPSALGVSTAQADTQKASILMADFVPSSAKDFTGTAERAHTLLANFDPNFIKDGQRAIAQI